MNMQSYVFLSEINQKNSRIPLTLRHKKFFNLFLQQERGLRINAFQGNRRSTHVVEVTSCRATVKC
jgi:hypothetical protein